MNVHAKVPSLIDIRQIIESFIFGRHLHFQNSSANCANSPEIDGTACRGKVKDCCVCAPCSDIISRSHSVSRAKYATHGRRFVHNWLETASAFDCTPPRQIPYGCD